MTYQGLAYAIAPEDDPVFADEADLVIPEWEVEVTPGGELVTLYGTVEEVVAQLRELNPNWDTDFPEVDEPEESANEFEVVLEEDDDDDHTTVKRTDFSGSEYGCSGIHHPVVLVERVQQGISYLRRVGGRPKIGHNVCSRVSCSYRAGIKWCNRVSHSHSSQINIET